MRSSFVCVFFFVVERRRANSITLECERDSEPGREVGFAMSDVVVRMGTYETLRNLRGLWICIEKAALTLHLFLPLQFFVLFKSLPQELLTLNCVCVRTQHPNPVPEFNKLLSARRRLIKRLLLPINYSPARARERASAPPFTRPPKA